MYGREMLFDCFIKKFNLILSSEGLLMGFSKGAVYLYLVFKMMDGFKREKGGRSFKCI